MGFRSDFSTSEDLETTGVWNEFPDFRVRISRAGGRNRAYLLAQERRIKPLRRRAGSVGFEEMKVIARDLFIEHCVKGWQTKVNGEWRDGLEPPAGCDPARLVNGLLPFTQDNVRQALDDVPDLSDALMGFADDISAYREERLEEAAGNSVKS